MDSALLAIILLLRLGSPDCWLVVVLSQNENRHGRWDALQFFLKQNAILSCSQIFSIVTTKQLSLVSSFPANIVKIVLLKEMQVYHFFVTHMGGPFLPVDYCQATVPVCRPTVGYVSL